MTWLAAEHSATNGTSIPHTLPQDSGSTTEREKKHSKRQRAAVKQHHLDMTELLTHDLTATAAARTKHAQDQDSQHLNMGRTLMRLPLLPGDLWTVEGFLGKKSQFPLRMWPLLGRSCSSGWHHIHAYMKSITGTQWVFFLMDNEV